MLAEVEGGAVERVQNRATFESVKPATYRLRVTGF
jgi:hypothetical protein